MNVSTHKVAERTFSQKNGINSKQRNLLFFSQITNLYQPHQIMNNQLTQIQILLRNT